MKLLNVKTVEGSRLAAIVPEGVVVFADQLKIAEAPAHWLPLTLGELVLNEAGVEKAQKTLAASASFAIAHSLARPLSEVTIAKLYEPRNILCVGKNYRAHAQE